MHEPWTSVIAVSLVALGVLGEFHLLRILLEDWREGRREEHGRVLRACPQAERFAQATWNADAWARRGRASRGCVMRRRFTLVIPFFTLPGAAAMAQDVGAAPAPSEPVRRALPSPWDSPPFPGSEYLGPTIGVPISTPDYPLMHALKDSAIGRWQKESRIDIYGWVNSSWNLSTSKASNLPNVYDIVPNRVELNQAVLRFERNPDTVQTDHADWGFRVTNMYGTDYRFTVAKGWFDQQLLKHNALYGFDMPELYGLVYVPDVGEGMVLKFGRFISPPDIEAQLAPDNYLFTHSTMFSIDPYTFTGALAQIRLSERWTIEPGIHAGSDMAPWSESASPNAHLMVRWVSRDNADSIWAGINSIGDGKYRNGHDNLQHLVGTWSHRFSDKVHMATEVYYMWQRDALKGGTVNDGQVQTFGGGGGPGALIPGLSDSLGAVNYFQVKLSEGDYISIRNDLLADYKGQRTGYTNLYSSHTIGWSHALSPSMTIRPEVKYERAYANPAYDNGRKKDQLKFGIDVILRF
jgi:hypothetical protein